jgi:hypothetical protein
MHVRESMVSVVVNVPKRALIAIKIGIAALSGVVSGNENLKAVDTEVSSGVRR